MTEKTIPNWGIFKPYVSIIQAIEIKLEDGSNAYRPMLVFILDQDIENPMALSMYMERIYDTSSELALEVTLNVNRIFPVSLRVPVLNAEGVLIDTHDVEEMVRISYATKELELIKRTDTLQIH